jgi:hypothetical protein
MVDLAVSDTNSFSSGPLEAGSACGVPQSLASVESGEGERLDTPWDHKDAWRKRGKDFLVEITRHNGSEDEWGKGPHRWCVYAYIYPKHPHFAFFDGPHMWQAAATCLPFHGYPSLLEYPMYEGKVTSVKVGADYDHLRDDRFTRMATTEDAYEVFADAQRLYDALSDLASSYAPTQTNERAAVTHGTPEGPLASNGPNPHKFGASSPSDIGGATSK